MSSVWDGAVEVVKGIVDPVAFQAMVYAARTFDEPSTADERFGWRSALRLGCEWAHVYADLLVLRTRLEADAPEAVRRLA